MFFAGGIGITLLLPTIKVALSEGHKAVLLNCNKSADREPFKKELEELQDKFVDLFSIKRLLLEPSKTGSTQRLTAKDMEFISPDNQIYMVEPRAFMREYKEIFGPMNT